MEAEDLEEYHKQKIMPNEDDVMTEIRDLLFGTGPKSKDVIDKCQEYARKYHHSKLQALKEEVRVCSVEVEYAIESQKEEGLPVPDWLKGQLHAFNKCLRIINDLKDNE